MPIVTIKEQKRWFPYYGREFFTILKLTDEWVVYLSTWYNADNDYKLLKEGLVFATEQQAEEAIQQLKALTSRFYYEIDEYQETFSELKLIPELKKEVKIKHEEVKESPITPKKKRIYAIQDFKGEDVVRKNFLILGKHNNGLAKVSQKLNTTQTDLICEAIERIIKEAGVNE